MTREQLLIKFPNASKSFIDANATEPRANCVEDSGDRTPAVIQKLEGDQQKPKNQRPVSANERQKSSMDEALHGRYRVTVEFLVSDKRGRDGDGMYSTIQDCFIAAVGRLTGLDRLALRKLATSEERRRGSNDND